MKKRYHLITTLPAMGILAGVLMFLLLPYLCELYLLPRLLEDLPFTEKKVHLSRLSPWKVRGAMAFSDSNQQILSIPHFEVHFTPGSLIQGKIARLLINSASLQVRLKNGKPVIVGLDTSANSDRGAPSLLLPMAVDILQLKNCTLTLNKNEQESLSFITDGEFTFDYDDRAEGKKLLTHLIGDFQVRGDQVFSGRIEVKSVHENHQVNLTLQSPDIGKTVSFFPQLQALRVTGNLTLRARATIEKLSTLADYEASIEISHFRFTKNTLDLQNVDEDTPVKLHLAGNNKKSSFSLSNLFFAEPEKGVIGLNGDVDLLTGSFHGTGHITTKKIPSHLTITVDGKKKDAAIHLDYQIHTDSFATGDSLYFSPLKIDGNLAIEGTSVNGILHGRISKIVDKKNKAALRSITLKMPLQFPLPEKGKSKAGHLSIGQLRHHNVNSGKLRVSLWPSNQGLAFTTLFTTPFAPQMRLKCKGNMQPTTDVSLDCSVPHTQVDSSSVPPFIQLPAEMSFEGKLSATGKFSIIEGIPDGQLRLTWNDALLTFGENTLSDINTEITFPRLPIVQSRPGQLCTIGAINFGKIQLSDARVNFRIEDEKTVFVERARLNWCGGKVEAGGVRVTKDMKELETTLYCDRLGFTELLEQFGIENTEGEGSLNGRLPILFNQNGLVFDDGFLFSTPGDSGIVRFNNTDQLRQGIPNINQTAYLEYSMKALENFAYNWTKLSFNSDKKDLLVTMQLDGKPASPLPYGYKSGHIVPSTEGPGLQHPIRLDVNFRLPLDDLFQYGKNIQSIMENM